MKKKNTDRNFLNKPAFPGGQKAMSNFIRQQLKYPEEAAKLGISGIVQVKITINKDGHVIDTDVIHGLGHGCDEEALRVAKLLTFEVPKNRGVKVKFFKKVNFGFGKKEVATKPQKAKTTIVHPVTYSTTDQSITSYIYSITSSTSKADQKTEKK